MEPTPHRRLVLVGLVLWGVLAGLAAVAVLLLSMLLMLLIPTIMSGPTDAGADSPLLAGAEMIGMIAAVVWAGAAVCDLVMLPGMIRRVRRPGRSAAVFALVAIATGTVLPLLTLPVLLLGPEAAGALTALGMLLLAVPLAARLGAVWEMRRERQAPPPG
jgi:predicted permease